MPRQSQPLFHRSLWFALQGVGVAVVSQRNLRIQLALGCLAAFLSYYFQISHVEQILVCLCIGMVLVTELLNTAVETVVDLVTQDVHPLAKKAKDIAAGAVLVSSMTALVVGLQVFYPYLKNSLFIH